MATFFYVTGGSGGWNNSNNWASSSGGTSGAGIPGSGDTATFDGSSGSGSITTDVSVSVSTLTLASGFIGTLTVGGGFSLTVTSTMTVTQGTLNTNGQTCTWGTFASNGSASRTLTFGSSTITVTSSFSTTWGTTTTGLTITANTATVNITGSGTIWSSSANWNGLSVVASGSQYFECQGLNCANLTRNNTSDKTASLQARFNAITLTGTLTLTGFSASTRLLVNTDTIGINRTISAGAVVAQYVDFEDITGGGAASWNLASITGGSGDCGGNSGITFSASATQTWQGTSGGNWSANAWTTRVPLPQDDVVINAAFSASQTITNDMPRLGRSINWTGATGSPKWSFGTTSNTIFGSLTLVSGMTTSGTSTSFTFGGRASYTITSAGVTHTEPVSIAAPGGTYTLQDSFVTNSSLTLSNGDLEGNNQNVTCSTFSSSNSNTRTLTLGTGTWTLTSTASGTIWNLGTTSGMTKNGASATIAIANASTNSRTFAGGGLSYGTLTYTVAGSTGALVITGANSFGTLNFSDASNARTITFPSSTTTTIRSTFNVNGVVGNLIVINASTPGTAAPLTYTGSGFVNCAYLSIQDSSPVQAGTWFAGHNSTFVSNTGNWVAGVASIASLSGGMSFSASEPKQTDVLLTAGH